MMGLRSRRRQRELHCASSGVEKRCHINSSSSSSSSGSSSIRASADRRTRRLSTAAAAAAAKAIAVTAVASANGTSNGSNSQMVHQLIALEPTTKNLSEMDLIKSASRAHSWHWNNSDRSHECIVSNDRLEVCFHPQCSESAAAIRGSEPLVRNGNYYYWEVTAFDKTYGTSVMFGLCSKDQKLHANDYCNLVGLDKNGWSLSHKGLIWHDGLMAQYCKAFPPNRTVTVGLLFNTMRGELSYFLDGKNLGVAFYGLNDVNSELYPVIGSTAKCTRIRLTGAYCGYVSLLERSCFTLIKNARDKVELLKQLQQQKVPQNLIRYLAEVCSSQTKITAKPDQYNWNVNNHHGDQTPINSIRNC